MLATLTRNHLASRINRSLDLPMAILSVLMLCMVLADVFLPTGSRARPWLEHASWVIWGVFVVEFAIKLFVVDDRRAYLRSHWFDVLVVVMPMFRVARALRFVVGMQVGPLVEFIAFIGKAIKALRAFFQQSRLGYLFGMTVLVAFFGAVGVFLFERDAEASSLRTFGDAMWWSTALMTTIGSEMAPVSTGGRLIALVMMVFAMVVVVYLIGAVSAFLLVSKKVQPRMSLAPSQEEVEGALGNSGRDPDPA